MEIKVWPIKYSVRLCSIKHLDFSLIRPRKSHYGYIDISTHCSTMQAALQVAGVFKEHSGYWSGNRMPIPMAIGLAISHVQGTDCKHQSDSCLYFMLCCLVDRMN